MNMSAHIEESIEYTKGEDHNEYTVRHKCVYNSISDSIVLYLDGEEINLELGEARAVFKMVNKCLERKGHSL